MEINITGHFYLIQIATSQSFRLIREQGSCQLAYELFAEKAKILPYFDARGESLPFCLAISVLK